MQGLCEKNRGIKHKFRSDRCDDASQAMVPDICDRNPNASSATLIDTDPDPEEC
jgi:hypothetical protein